MTDRELTEALTRRARAEGWKKNDWKPAVRAVLRDPRLKKGHEADRYRSGVEEVHEAIADFPKIPDLWRIKVEGPSDEWQLPVLVLEFLEIEVTSHLTPEKMFWIENLWWRFDATEIAHLRVFRMDRFGTTTRVIDETNAVELLTRPQKEDHR